MCSLSLIAISIVIIFCHHENTVILICWDEPKKISLERLWQGVQDVQTRRWIHILLMRAHSIRHCVRADKSKLNNWILTFVQDSVRKLPIEAIKQANHVKDIDQRLGKLKELMEQKGKGSGREILDHCIFPRLVLSAEDAMFCAAFFEKMHNLDVAGFGTITLMNAVSSLIWLIY